MRTLLTIVFSGISGLVSLFFATFVIQSKDMVICCEILGVEDCGDGGGCIVPAEVEKLRLACLLVGPDLRAAHSDGKEDIDQVIEAARARDLREGQRRSYLMR